MINPITGSEIHDEKQKVFLYGLDEASQKLITYLLSRYNVIDVTDCFTDLIAIKATAMFVNLNRITTENYDILNEIFGSDEDRTLMVFTEEPNQEINFKYHIVDLKDSKDYKLKRICSHLNKKLLHLEWNLSEEFMNNVILLDGEVSGVDKYADELICLNALYIENNKINDSFFALIRPRFKLSTEIEEITQITNKQLEEAEGIVTVLKRFEHWRKNIKILIWNDEFIYPFYDRAYKEIEVYDTDFIHDLRNMMYELYPNNMNSRLKEQKEFAGVLDTDTELEAMNKVFSKIYSECVE